MSNEHITIENLTEYNSNLLRDANVLKRSTAYIQGNVVNKGQVYLQCTVSGTTASTALNLSGVVVDDIVTDGTVTWKVLSVMGVSFEQDGGGTSIKEWETNTLYKVSDMVLYNNTLYKCNTEHTSSTFSSDSSSWNFIYGEIQEWTANTYYKVGSNVIYENQLYKCTTAHTSSSVWDDIKWQVIGGGSGSSGTGYSQIDLVNISAPYTIDIEIANNPNHVLPPIDVLKYTQGYHTTNTMMNFNPEDESKFDYDKIKFESGYMMINQSSTADFAPAQSLGNDYVRESEPIDLSTYKSVESVVVV